MEFHGSTSADDITCHTNCYMNMSEIEHYDVVAIVRLVTGLSSFIGALSIILSAVYTRTTNDPKVHPIVMLSLVDIVLSVLWISGAVLWLRGGVSHTDKMSASCFAISCSTVVLQCVAMNVTLIYAVMAYSSIKHGDSIYVSRQREYGRYYTQKRWFIFTLYLSAWTLPIVFIMFPFGYLDQFHNLVERANNCTCWCLPYFGNILPRPSVGPHKDENTHRYVIYLHYFITSYAVTLIINFTGVLCCMITIYYKIFRQIKQRLSASDYQDETSPLYQHNKNLMITGFKKAKIRVSLFFLIYLLSGIMTFIFGIVYIYIEINGKSALNKRELATDRTRLFVLLIFEALLVPSQGLFNSLAYGWTREGFSSAITTRQTKQTCLLPTSCQEEKNSYSKI